jgi:hypothetical protein
MTDIIIHDRYSAKWRDGRMAISLDTFSGNEANAIMNLLVSRLKALGYSILDKRQPDIKLCKRCHEPTGNNRSIYCPDCRVIVLKENRRQQYQRG